MEINQELRSFYKLLDVIVDDRKLQDLKSLCSIHHSSLSGNKQEACAEAFRVIDRLITYKKFRDIASPNKLWWHEK